MSIKKHLRTKSKQENAEDNSNWELVFFLNQVLNIMHVGHLTDKRMFPDDVDDQGAGQHNQGAILSGSSGVKMGNTCGLNIVVDYHDKHRHKQKWKYEWGPRLHQTL